MEENLGRVEGIIQGLNHTIQQLNKSLYGNGQPGILDRQAKLEEIVENLADKIQEDKELEGQMIQELRTIAKENRELILRQSEKQGVLLQGISDLKGLLEDHIKDKSVHTFKSMIFAKENIVWVILGFLVLHSLLPAVEIEQIRLIIFHALGIPIQ